MTYVDNIVPDVPFEGRRSWRSFRGTRQTIRNHFASMIENWKQRREQKRSIQHLRRLSDHTLRDIGIHRSEISSMVVHGRSGRRSRA